MDEGSVGKPQTRPRRPGDDALILQATLDSTADGLLVVDEEGRTTFANARFAELWRIPEDVLATRSDERLIEFVLGQLVDPDAFLSKVRELYGTDAEAFDTLHFKDGRVFERYSRPLVRDGVVAGRVWSFRDVTERHRADEALRRSEERYRALFEGNPHPMWVYDLETLEFLAVNDAAVEHYGYSEEEFLSMTIKDIRPPEEVPALLQHLASPAPPVDVTGVWRHRKSDGSIIDVEIVSHGLEFAGRPARLVLADDVTDRRPAEEDLREAEERYRTLVEQIPMVVYMDTVDERSATMYISPQVEALLGFPREQWLRDPVFWKQVVHPEDRARVLGTVARHQRSGEPRSVEYRMIARDGRVLWMRDVAALIRDAEGRPRFWQGALSDVTDRKRAEDQLREAETRYRALVERIPAILYVDALDERSTSVYVSPQVQQVLGLSQDEWLGDPDAWERALHPDDRERITAEYRAARDRGEPFTLEYRMIRADGNDVWIREEAAVIPGSEDRPGVVQGVMVDITEPKRAEEQLRATEAQYRALVERIPLVAYTDLPTETMDTIYVSPQIESVLGFTQEEYLSDPTLWERHLHPEDRERVLASYRRYLEGAGSETLEYRMILRDGRTVWIQDRAVILRDETGRPELVQGVMVDITEQKKAEDAMREALEREREAAAQLRTLDDMKNTFLNAVSHELRTPLTAILGAALTLDRTGDGLPADDRRDLLRRLAGNARKLDRLLADLLDLDRLSRGIVEPKRRPTDVSVLTREIVEGSGHLRGRAVTLELEPATAWVEAAKVERIVENLIVNTARHTTPDTPVWVRVQSAEEGVLIAVEDQGPGVPPEYQKRIFEPFQQIGDAASAHAPGVGIGLSLVARFAELHGGRAWVQERAGGGSSFRVFLPRGGPAPPDSGEPEPVATDPAQGAQSGGAGTAT